MGLEGTKVADPWDTRAQNQYLKTLSRERASSQEALKRMLQKLEQIILHWMWETLGVDEQQGEGEHLLGKALHTTSQTQTAANSPASVCPSVSPFVFLVRKLFVLGRCLFLPTVGFHKQQYHVTFLFFSLLGNSSVMLLKRLCASSSLLAKGAHFYSWWSHYLITV